MSLQDFSVGADFNRVECAFGRGAIRVARRPPEPVRRPPGPDGCPGGTRSAPRRRSPAWSSAASSSTVCGGSLPSYRGCRARPDAAAADARRGMAQHGDEQVRPDAVALRVPDRSRADLRLQAAEGGLDLGQLPVGPRDPLQVPVGVAGAQHVGAGPGVLAGMLVVALPPAPPPALAARLAPRAGCTVRIMVSSCLW